MSTPLRSTLSNKGISSRMVLISRASIFPVTVKYVTVVNSPELSSVARVPAVVKSIVLCSPAIVSKLTNSCIKTILILSKKVFILL